MRDDDTEILNQSGLLWAAESSLSMEKEVDSFTLSIQLFLSRSRRRPTSNVSWGHSLVQRVMPGDMFKPIQLSLF
ncbi:hypothetical protein DPMN_050263 [Dreissena polymorpha]|uniref:Uncharacterized protein n=1 Tax=Dreissena polymorpha TaxID=45954 RepID=A0A9D4CHN5_DREPO|nr:hypothetical protein DPMN_050263 [Dreissena polymorpha]